MFGWTHRTGSVQTARQDWKFLIIHGTFQSLGVGCYSEATSIGGSTCWRVFFFCVVIFRCFMGDWDWYHETSLCSGGEFKICFMISPRALWSNLTIVNMFQMGGSTYSWWRFDSVKTWGFEYWISHHVLRVFHAFEVVVTTMSHHQHEQVTKSLSHYVHWLCCDI